ncbi:methyltransferase family protein [Corynebacterium halotolerans]|uniref:methyltransferase family protein n=1 Tax=Corynebacterium halotolerans TaxID=225326 RepID=UPI003CEF488A
MRIPPPVWAGAAGLAQLLLARGSRATRASTSTAVLLGAGAAGLGLGAVGQFRARGTTVDPVELDRSAALVTGGVFALTRNPMYLAVTGLLLAHAAHRRSLAALLPVAGFVLVIDRCQIPAEETALARIFGAEYGAYRRRVPRWAPLY